MPGKGTMPLLQLLRGEATKAGLAQHKARREESKKYREENMYDICMVTNWFLVDLHVRDQG